LLLLAAPAFAQMEGAHRQLVDAGVHVPVLTKAPKLLEFVQADYPPEAAKTGLGADVRLIVTIDKDGNVPDAKVKDPQGNGFDEAAIDAVKRFKFSPAEIDDVPAAVQIEYVYHFRMEVPDAGAPAPDSGVEPPPKLATLKGELIVRGNRSHIPAGSVRCDNLPDAGEVYSDDKGVFSITFPAGFCRVIASANGFHNFETDETLEPDEIRSVKYYMLQKNIGYETVVRDVKEKKEVVDRTLTREELQKVPGSFGDPVRVLQDFPGVARSPYILGQLIVRGADPSETQTYLDGVQVPLLFHLLGGPSVINSEFIDSIDFFPGGFGARYGRAIGGTVDVSTRKGSADTWHVVGQADFQAASLFVEAPVTDNVSVAGAVRRSYIDAILPTVLNIVNPPSETNGTLLVLPVYWDYQVRVDVGAKRGQTAVNGASSFSVMAFGSDDMLTIAQSGTGTQTGFSLNYHTLFHRLIATWMYKAPNVTFKLAPWAGYDLAAINAGGIGFSADRWTAGLRADLAVDVNKWLTIRGGADIYDEHLVGEAELPILSGDQYVDFPGSDPKTQTQRIAATPETFDGALYLEGDLRLGPVTVTPGLRATHSVVYGNTMHSFDPRLWVKYDLFPKWTTLKGSVGLYSQAPSAFDMAPPPLGNPALTYERAFQTSLGVKQKITDSINIDVTGFYNRRYDEVTSPGLTTVNPDGTVTQLRSGNVGLGRAYGLEVMLRQEVTKNLFGWIAYTFSRSVDSRTDAPTEYLDQYDQTHNLIIVASYRIPLFCKREVACAGWEFGGRFRYVTGNPTTPLIHDYDLYRNDANGFSGTYGAYRSSRLPPFHQLDLRLDKNFVFDKWTLGVYLDVQNVYNAKNTEGTITDYRFRTQYQVPGIPFLPILGIKGSL
jgi:TonB family protein